MKCVKEALRLEYERHGHLAEWASRMSGEDRTLGQRLKFKHHEKTYTQMYDTDIGIDQLVGSKIFNFIKSPLLTFCDFL